MSRFLKLESSGDSGGGKKFWWDWAIFWAFFLLLIWANLYMRSHFQEAIKDSEEQRFYRLFDIYFQEAQKLQMAETGIIDVSWERLLYNSQADSNTVREFRERIALLQKDAAEARAKMEVLRKELLPLMKNWLKRHKLEKLNEPVGMWT